MVSLDIPSISKLLDVLRRPGDEPENIGCIPFSTSNLKIIAIDLSMVSSEFFAFNCFKQCSPQYPNCVNLLRCHHFSLWIKSVKICLFDSASIPPLSSSQMFRVRWIPICARCSPEDLGGATSCQGSEGHGEYKNSELLNCKWIMIDNDGQRQSKIEAYWILYHQQKGELLVFIPCKSEEIANKAVKNWVVKGLSCNLLMAMSKYEQIVVISVGNRIIALFEIEGSGLGKVNFFWIDD